MNLIATLLKDDSNWLEEFVGGLVRGLGGTAIVSGPPGDGRVELFDLFAERCLAERRIRVIRGNFDQGSYVAADRREAAIERALGVASGALSIASPMWGVAAFVAQIVAQSTGAEQLLRSALGRGPSSHMIEMTPLLLRESARDKPLVCIIDDPESTAHGWWLDLLLTFSRRIARTVPILMVLGIMHDSGADRPPSLDVVDELEAAGVAAKRQIGRVSPDRVGEAIGRCDFAIPTTLAEITGGRAGWIARIWSDWCRKAVVTDASGRWRFSSDHGSAVLDAQSDYLTQRLLSITGTNDPHLLMQLDTVLACGALEGRTFTANAVGLALLADGISAYDLIDAHLLRSHSHEPPFLREGSPLIISDERGTRELRRLEFTGRYDWVAAQRFGFPEERRRSKAQAMARALISLSGSTNEVAALAIARLLTSAGDAKGAAHYQRLTTNRLDRRVAIWRANEVLRSGRADSSPERERRVSILLDAASAVYHSGPFETGRRFAVEAARAAQSSSSRAWALYYASWFNLHLGKSVIAARELREALTIFEDVNERVGIANAQHQLANLELAAGRYSEAEGRYLAVIELRRLLNDVEHEGRAYEALGDCALGVGDLALARERWATALDRAEQSGDRLGAASVRLRIAQAQITDRDFAVSRKVVTECLAVFREFGDSRDEATALDALIELELAGDQTEEAAAAANALARLADAVGDPEYQRQAQKRLRDVRGVQARRKLVEEG